MSLRRPEYLSERTLPARECARPRASARGPFLLLDSHSDAPDRPSRAEGLNRHDETHARDPRPPRHPGHRRGASRAPARRPSRGRPDRAASGDRRAGRSCESLEALGVEVVFGIPGGAILPAYDPLFDSKVRHILVRHEQGAGHAATGYAQATGKVGVCIATSGPGATNLVTPIADAYMDSVPIVAITGQVPRAGDRHGRLPGGRHPGHHAADHQAQLPGADGRGHPADPGRGVPPGRHRPARPGAGRHPQGRAAGADHVQPGRPRWTCPATGRRCTRTASRSARRPG